VRARDHRFVVWELTFDQARRHHEVRHLEHELIVGDRELDLFTRSDDTHDLGDGFPWNDAGRTRDALTEAPHGKRQAMSVGRHHAYVFALVREQYAVESIAWFVVRHREARLGEHLA